MPGSTSAIPEMPDGPVPAFRPSAEQPLRGRLPAAGRAHRRDPATGDWLEVDELAQLDGSDESEDEFSALQRDAEEQIRKLRADRARLALPSLSDPKVHAELLDVESRLHAAKAELERIPLARQESARQAAERIAQEDEKRRLAARAAAEKLLSKRLGVMKNFDEAAQQLAQAVTECEALSVEADQRLQQAGEQPGAGMLAQGAYQRGLRFALVGAGVSGRAIAFEGVASGHLGPLAG